MNILRNTAALVALIAWGSGCMHTGESNDDEAFAQDAAAVGAGDDTVGGPPPPANGGNGGLGIANGTYTIGSFCAGGGLNSWPSDPSTQGEEDCCEGAGCSLEFSSGTQYDSEGEAETVCVFHDCNCGTGDFVGSDPASYADDIAFAACIAGL